MQKNGGLAQRKIKLNATPKMGFGGREISDTKNGYWWKEKQKFPTPRMGFGGRKKQIILTANFITAYEFSWSIFLLLLLRNSVTSTFSARLVSFSICRY